MRVQWRNLGSAFTAHAWPLWLLLFGFMFSGVMGYFSAFLTMPNFPTRVRYAGVLLEILGFVLVAIGIRNTRKLFARPSLSETIVQRCKAVAGTFVTTKHESVVTATGRFRLRVMREPDASSARVERRNQPGGGMLARDASWSVSLLSLPGRNGLDLGLGLSYSSMVWTRSGPYIHFDEDNGFPSPGFRLGFPSMQRRVFNAQTAKNAYVRITSSGQRVELRQVGTSNVYEAADSSYLQLTTTDSLTQS